MEPTDQNKAAQPSPQEEPAAPPSSPVILLWSDTLAEMVEMADAQAGIYARQTGSYAHEGHLNSLQPQRLTQAYQLLKAIGALQWQELQIVPPDESLAEIEGLKRFHDSRYCEAVLNWENRQADFTEDERFGFSENATAAFTGMADVAGHYVAGARTAVRVAASHPTLPIRVVSLAGEQVHARTNQAESGDIFNDIALALLDAQSLAKKVAFINLDAEHPIVIQELFFKERNVMTISLHEGPSFLYPGTGSVQEIGKGLGHGFNVNLPLPPGAGDAQLLQAFEQVIEPLLKRFEPDLLILLGGCSAHISEPLAHLRLTSHGYQQLVERATLMAARFVLLGGDGTDWALSARLWTLVVMKLAGRTMITDHSTSKLPYLGFEHYLNQLRNQTLQDAALSRLPQSMQEYVDYMLHMTLLEAQQLLFPLWNIPISADFVRMVESKLMAQNELHQRESAIEGVRDSSRSKKPNLQPNHTPNNSQRDFIREELSTYSDHSDARRVSKQNREYIRHSDERFAKRKDKERDVKDNRHKSSTRHRVAHPTDKSPTTQSGSRSSQKERPTRNPKRANVPKSTLQQDSGATGEHANNKNKAAQGPSSTTDTPRRSPPRRNPLSSSSNEETNQMGSKSDQERKRRNRKRRQRRQNKKRGGGKG